MEITIEEIQKKFESLPEDLKWAIMEANVDENLMEIGKTNGLTVEQTGQLALETHMVMMGFVHPEKFEEAVKNSLDLPPEKVRSLVVAVNDKILKNIRESMMSLYDKKEEVSDIIHIEKPFQGPMPEETLAKLESEPELPPGSVPAEKKLVPPIFIEKLSGSFKAPITKTDYSLNPEKTDAVTTAPADDKPKVDPYRELPE